MCFDVEKECILGKKIINVTRGILFYQEHKRFFWELFSKVNFMNILNANLHDVIYR